MENTNTDSTGTEISGMLLKTIEFTLDTIFRASETDIRVHGADQIPDQPVLYVVNHFTRMETFMVPYLIKKNLNKYPISLAHYSFFTGKIKDILDKLGAVSTKDPERDRKLIGTLLTDRNPVIIFPEGQMIKDKKIVEKGKYMVYNSGIRRPPHRGAARLALRAQLYREKIRRFHNEGNKDALAAYSDFFHFSNGDLERVLEQETYIVPVNLTYYPIRARNNAINRIVDRFVKDLPVRMEEEIEVEGTMLIEGVDIDLNLGEPIPIRDYIFKSKKARKLIYDDILYLDSQEIKKASPFEKIDLQLMHRYMESIYRMTTVNHDHIFSYILSTCSKAVIDENDFKNRAFFAVEKLRESGVNNYHTTLDEKQFYLLTDDFHEKYSSFIKAAESDGLISVKDKKIYKDKRKFSRVYQFHTIRKDNIVEVLKNEIEPLESLMKLLKKLMRISPRRLKKIIRNHFIQLDNELFEKDYEEFYIEGETKPKEIGRPFFLKRFFKRMGIILVHGYMAAPEEIRPLAEFLHKHGYCVYGARLRGHGTAPEDLESRNWEKWYDSVGRAYIIMKNSTRDFAIGGFSTGAGLALLQAANKPDIFKGVISINAPLKLQNISSKLSTVVVMWNKILEMLHVEKGKKEYVTNNPENPHINYFRNPIYGVRELGKLMKEVENKLKFVLTPTLIIQGSNDPVVNPVSGPQIHSRLGTENKTLIRIYSDRHGIVRGKEAEKVQTHVLEFLTEVFSRS